MAFMNLLYPMPTVHPRLSKLCLAPWLLLRSPLAPWLLRQKQRTPREPRYECDIHHALTCPGAIQLAHHACTLGSVDPYCTSAGPAVLAAALITEIMGTATTAKIAVLASLPSP